MVSPFNISAKAKDSNFKFGLPLTFVKAHHKITSRIISKCGTVQWEPPIFDAPFNICAMTEASDFKFGLRLGFAQTHHKMPPRKKTVGLALVWGTPQYLGFPFNSSATDQASGFKFGTQLGFAEANRKIMHTRESGHRRRLEYLPKICGSGVIFCNGLS